MCKLWSSFATQSFLAKYCVERLGFKPEFKPANRDWKWVIMSKRALPPEDSDTKVSGIGCRVSCPKALLK